MTPTLRAILAALNTHHHTRKATMSTDRPGLDDPRVLALARARQQVAHEGVLLPTWDELTDQERADSLPSARSYLHAALRAGLVRAADVEADNEQLRQRLGRIIEHRNQVEAERDGAYRERAQLLAWLAAMHPAVIAPALDIDDEDGWQILFVWAGGQQLTWHIAPRDDALFEHVEHVDFADPRAAWDGHTTDEKYERIRQHTARLGDDEHRQLLQRAVLDALTPTDEPGPAATEPPTCPEHPQGPRIAGICILCPARPDGPGA